MSWEQKWMLLAFSAYFAASCLYILHMVWLKVRVGNWAYGAAVAGMGANTAALLSRAYALGRMPLANMYEFGMLLVWAMSAFYLLLERRQGNRLLGAFVFPLIFILTGIFAVFYREGKPLMPALKSSWLSAHVLTALVAYGMLAVAFALALMYLWKADLEEKGETGSWFEQLPSLELLERLVNRCILLALPFLTLLIVTGAVWAEYAWGSYWRWDPKETWSLITWLIYAVYLHGRVFLGWKGKRLMHWAVFGFLAVLVTFIGVNLLLPGFHSYAV